MNGKYEAIAINELEMIYQITNENLALFSRHSLNKSIHFSSELLLGIKKRDFFFAKRKDSK